MKLEWQILTETENWVAINKPSGLLSVPDREGKETSLKQLLQKKYGSIFAVHRLDRETSGVILFAKNYSKKMQTISLFEYTLEVQKDFIKKAAVKQPTLEEIREVKTQLYLY